MPNTTTKQEAPEPTLQELSDFTGRFVVLSEAAMSGEYKAIEWRVVMAAGGSGCRAGAGGSSVFVQFHDHDESAFGVGQVERLATADEIAEFERRWEASKK